jgi:hypothetical protein
MESLDAEKIDGQRPSALVKFATGIATTLRIELPLTVLSGAGKVEAEFVLRMAPSCRAMTRLAPRNCRRPNRRVEFDIGNSHVRIEIRKALFGARCRRPEGGEFRRVIFRRCSRCLWTIVVTVLLAAPACVLHDERDFPVG